MDAADLDLVLVATCTADELVPHTSALLAAELGATRAGAIDIGAACTGFVSALSLAAGVVESRRADRVLVVWAEILGPTAIAIARRLGRAATDLEVDVPFEALTAALAIPPRKALEALRRLHHHRLIEYYEAAANIAVSGWAPSMPGRLAVTLSGYARNAYGDLEPDPPAPPMFQPGRRRRDVLVGR